MGSLCCSHNRKIIKSIEEETALTANEEDFDENNIELEYPEKGNNKQEYKEREYPYLCQSLENCQSTLNVSQIIKYYISWITTNSKSKESKQGIYHYIHTKFGETYSQFNYNNVELINDFNHILNKHSNDISLILKQFNIKNDNNDINNFIFNRNNRNRSQFEQCIKMYLGFEESEEIISQQLCDRIHSYLFSKQISNKNIIINNDHNDDKNEESKTESKDEINVLIKSHENDQYDDEYIVINKQFAIIQNELKEEKINFRKLRGFTRINNENKFISSIPNNTNSIKFYYWDYYKDNDWFIHSRFKNLKSEILNCSINTIQFNIIHKTATNYFNCNYCKHKMICNTDEYKLKYEICKGQYIELHHIFSCFIYCHYDGIRDKLISTYYKMPIEETTESVKHRHSEFYHIAKSLRELIECFGQNNNNNNKDISYYHIINQSMILLSNTREFNINYPYSTTIKYDIIYLNCNEDNGLILSLSDKNNDKLKHFVTNWISDYPLESEHIFIGNDDNKYLFINTIISCKNNHDYTIYLEAHFMIKNLFDGKKYEYCNNNNNNNNDNETLQFVAKRLITNRIYNAYSDWESLPIYIQKITDNYFQTQINVNINYKLMKETEKNGGYNFLKDLLLNNDDDQNDNDFVTFISIDIFKLLFKNLREIIIDFTDCIKKNEYLINGRLFSYILLHLKAINWHQIMIILPDNYDEDKLFSIINSFKYQFEQFNWTLKRESYQNRIIFLNNNNKLKSLSLRE